jgi:acetyl esterase/lipase
MMATALRAAGVEHQLISVEGAEHGLDGADQRTIDAVLDRAVSFLRLHLGVSSG